MESYAQKVDQLEKEVSELQRVIDKVISGRTDVRRNPVTDSAVTEGD